MKQISSLFPRPLGGEGQDEGVHKFYNRQFFSYYQLIITVLIEMGVFKLFISS